MNRALYIGATSLIANQKRMDVLSNNLANINTAGYKKDISITESFAEKLLIKQNRIPEFRNIGKTREIEFEELEGDIYIARTKDGYFTLETPHGKSYVKEVKLVADDDGYLKTSYQNLEVQNRTDHENYLLDQIGNRIQAGGNVEDSLRNSVYFPAPYTIGTLSGGVKFQKLFVDFSQGGFMDTGARLDLALNGSGFFKVQGNEDQTLYTRNGSFALSQGYLTDLDGRRILGTGGEIFIGEGMVDISASGEVRVDDNLVAILDIVDFENKEFLRKVGDNSYVLAEDSEVTEVPFEGQVLQGHLETSNMNPISGMVEMINILREFEANQKVVKMQDEMLEKAATELGRI